MKLVKLALFVAAASLAAHTALRTTSAAAPLARAPAAMTYEIDPVHSSLVFRVKHMGVSHFWGRFNRFGGKVVVDDADASKCSVTMEVEAASVDTANEDRDKHLRSPDFFNAKQFASIRFASSKVAKAADGYAVEGELELHGVKKPVKIAMAQIGKGSGIDGEPLIGFEGKLAIKRSDYGMDYGMPDAIGDEVELVIAIEAASKK